MKAGKKLGPLHGVPMTMKKTSKHASYPRPAATRRSRTIPRRTRFAQRLVDAGVTLFGKTNVPLNLADWQSYNEVYGTTKPWDLAHAGRLVRRLGRGAGRRPDRHGIRQRHRRSIRNPAPYNGVYGHKPTYGVVSYKGHQRGAVGLGDITVVGPLARGAEDLEIAMDAIAGPDEIDGRGWKLSLPRSKKTKLRDFKVAVLLSDPNAEVDQSVQTEIQKLADFLAKKKTKVSDKARPAIDTAELNDVFVRLLRAATSGPDTPSTRPRR